MNETDEKHGNELSAKLSAILAPVTQREVTLEALTWQPRQEWWEGIRQQLADRGFYSVGFFDDLLVADATFDVRVKWDSEISMIWLRFEYDPIHVLSGDSCLNVRIARAMDRRLKGGREMPRFKI
jgi:hypothetical protein